MTESLSESKHYYSNQKWMANVFIILGGLCFIAGIIINNPTLFAATLVGLVNWYKFKQPLVTLNKDTFSFRAVPTQGMKQVNYADLVNVSIEGKKLWLHFKNDKKKFIHTISESTKQSIKDDLSQRI